MLVGQGDAQLYDFKQVDVATKRLVGKFGLIAKVSQRTGHDAGKLGIHGYVWIFFYHSPQNGHLDLQVLCPDVSDYPLPCIAHLVGEGREGKGREGGER